MTFLTGLPIAYYAARHGLDMDLLTRGAGFGYIGSTITSLIYASFTFIFFALEAAIMALAIELATGLPLSIGYLLCAVVILPMVAYGITFINRLQSWTSRPGCCCSCCPTVSSWPRIRGRWPAFCSSPASTGAAVLSAC